MQVLPEELTTSLASAILGVSRPTLMKRIEAGEIPAHKVGSHTRINRDDLMRYRRSQEARRQAAIEGFLDIDDDL
ncbi:possible excisionase [Gulosibacter sp. 10]|nr:possible excisionase [Gulosibacter sp. 10]